MSVPRQRSIKQTKNRHESWRFFISQSLHSRLRNRWTVDSPAALAKRWGTKGLGPLGPMITRWTCNHRRTSWRSTPGNWSDDLFNDALDAQVDVSSQVPNAPVEHHHAIQRGDGHKGTLERTGVRHSDQDRRPNTNEHGGNQGVAAQVREVLAASSDKLVSEHGHSVPGICSSAPGGGKTGKGKRSELCYELRAGHQG